MRRYFPAPGMIALVLFAVINISSAFAAERRVALVIGNSAYERVPQLPNPERDAASIAEMFRTVGFDVVEVRANVGNALLRRTLADFYDQSSQSQVAVIYYAGHGIEVDGQNYLVPVDAFLARDRDAPDEAVSLDRALQAVDPAKQLRLVILDACRDNPFAKTMKRTLALRAVSRGLASVEPSRANTLIAFAAKNNSTAEDGTGIHSPFTQALLHHLTAPGLDIRIALGRVRDDVMVATDSRQEPFVYGSLGGGEISLVPALPDKQAPQSELREEYQMTERVGTVKAWDRFLKRHPDGYYADLATAQKNKLAALPPRVGEGQSPLPPTNPPSDSDVANFCRFRTELCISAGIGKVKGIEGLCRAAQSRCLKSAGVFVGPVSKQTWKLR